MGLWMVILATTLGWAEYRVFELKISKKTDPEDYRLVLSTLDPLQYPGYHPVYQDELVQYTRTWRCPGSTAMKPLCRDPKEIAAEQAELEAENPTQNP